MASDRWNASHSLNQRLLTQYGSFNVFQLVRLLRHRRKGKVALRFRADLKASFQGGEITALQTEAGLDIEEALSGPIVLHTANYCVASELGPLPVPFLEWVRELQREGLGAMAAFLNLFNQRIHELRYELKRRNLRALDPAMPADTRYAAQLAALMGLASPGQQAQIPLPKRAWLGMAGLLVNNRRSAEVVSLILSRYLGARVDLVPLVGCWREIEPCDRAKLGRRDIRLGQNSLLGYRMWDSQAGVRLKAGPLPFEQILSLLPLSASRAQEALPVSHHAALVGLIHLLLDRHFDCEVELDVIPESLPESRLQRVGEGIGLRLSQTAWLITGSSRTLRDSSFVGPKTGNVPSPVRFRVDAYERRSGELAA